jgi:hypothetical protein
LDARVARLNGEPKDRWRSVVRKSLP